MSPPTVEPCERPEPGVLTNAACRTCDHTMAAHTSELRCDVCAVIEAIADFAAELHGRRRL